MGYLGPITDGRVAAPLPAVSWAGGPCIRHGMVAAGLGGGPERRPQPGEVDRPPGQIRVAFDHLAHDLERRQDVLPDLIRWAHGVH